MTWKLYTLSSTAAVLATLLWSSGPSIAPTPVASARRADNGRSTAPVDLGIEADRLHAGIAAINDYRAPVRNAFSFGNAPRRAAVVAAPPVADESLPAPQPVRPPFALAGMATSRLNGVMERTAIISSQQGIQLVKEGDTLDGGYRVVAIGDDDVTIEAPDQGARTTLRLSTP